MASRRIRELGVGEDAKARVGDLYFPDTPCVSKRKPFILVRMSRCSGLLLIGRFYEISMQMFTKDVSRRELTALLVIGYLPFSGWLITTPNEHAETLQSSQ